MGMTRCPECHGVVIADMTRPEGPYLVCGTCGPKLTAEQKAVRNRRISQAKSLRCGSTRELFDDATTDG